MYMYDVKADAMEDAKFSQSRYDTYYSTSLNNIIPNVIDITIKNHIN